MAQDSGSQNSLFSIVASNLTIIGAAVYASGWLYLKHYYSLFDIEVGELELGWHEVLLYSLSVVGHIARSLLKLQSLVLIGTAILAVWAMGYAWPELRNRVSALCEMPLMRSALPVALALGLSAGLLEAARRSGLENARKHWNAELLPIHLKLNSNCSYPLLEKDIELRELLRLKSTPKLHIFFSRNNDHKADPSAVDVRTYRVPTTCIQGFATRLHTKLEN